MKLLITTDAVQNDFNFRVCDHSNEATVQYMYFPVVLFIKLYKVVLTFESVTIPMNATVQQFPKVLFTTLYKVAVTFESVDESLKVTIQMKATVQYFPTVLLNTL